MQDFSLALLLPQILLLVFAALALAVGLWSGADGWLAYRPDRLGRPLAALLHGLNPGLLGACGLLLALVAQGQILFGILPQFGPLPVTQLSDALTVDPAGIVFGMVACLATLGVIPMAADHFADDRKNSGELHFLLLCACAAVTMAALAADLLSVYLSLEFLSVTSYVLAGFRRSDARSVEAAIKYFLFGAACSAATLYGMSVLFGMTGTLSLRGIGESLMLGQFTSPALWVATLLTLTAVAFKVAAVPFHLWAPDVYQGAPTPVTAFLSVASKAAGLAVLLRLLWTCFAAALDWVPLVGILSAASMTLGNLAAIPQKNVKRMLAYSSISHAGYFLIGFAALGVTLRDPRLFALQGVLVYLAGYLLANIGTFAAVNAVERLTGSAEIPAYRGLMQRSPGLAIALVVFFLSLAGLPPTLGFAGKFWVFAAAIKTNIQLLWWLAAIGVANSVVSVYYYFNVARAMFFEEPRDPAPLPAPVASASVVWACALASVALLVALQPLARAAASGAWMSFVPR